MKIARVNHHGQTRYRVNNPHGEGAKRQRLFFETREEAEKYVKERTEDARAYGVRFATIPPEQRAGIVYQLERLTKLGWELPAAVNFIERHGKATPAIPLGEVAKEFLTAKETPERTSSLVRKLLLRKDQERERNGRQDGQFSANGVPALPGARAAG